MKTQKFILRPSEATTTAKTEVGDWFDISDYSELYAWLNVTAFAARVDETLTVTIEREADNTAGYTTILAFDVINVTGAQSQEALALLFIGGRIRVRCVTAGTWTAKSITYSVKCYVK